MAATILLETTTLVILAAALLLAWAWWHDRHQTQHTILRNYPVIGRFRYFAETWGEYMRQYHYLPDWAERPFNRLERSWVYRSAKGVSNLVSFGSETNPHFIFRNAAFARWRIDAARWPRTISTSYCFTCCSIAATSLGPSV